MKTVFIRKCGFWDQNENHNPIIRSI